MFENRLGAPLLISYVLYCLKKNQNAPIPSEHPPILCQVQHHIGTVVVAFRPANINDVPKIKIGKSKIINQSLIFKKHCEP